jgi:septal ring factor EnvC (AmiA/AmiB activator)
MDALPDDIASLRAALAQAEARADAAEAEAARARAMASNTEALIAGLKLEIKKLRRQLSVPFRYWFSRTFRDASGAGREG